MTDDNRKATRRPGSNVDDSLARYGGLSYLEIPAIDARKSAAFYAAVVGWKIEGGDGDHPKFMDRTGHLLGRWITGRPAAREPGLLPYIYVDRIDVAVAAAQQNGGEIVEGPRAESDLLVAKVRDPAGNLIGLWQDSCR